MSGRELQILLVEDNDEHAELVTYALEQAEQTSHIERCTNGEAAVEHLRDRLKAGSLPDLVLLDLKLPRLDGLEVLAKVKSDRELRRVPVVMLTTSDAEHDRDAAYANHVNSYLVKPVDYSRFCEMMADLCRYWGRWNQAAHLNPGPGPG